MPDIRIILAMRAYSYSINQSLVKLKAFLGILGTNPVLLSHPDADGLCAAAILKRLLKSREIDVQQLYPAKGEDAFSAGTLLMLRQTRPTSVILLDLGVSAEDVVAGAPTMYIDHHRPFGKPENAIVLTSYGSDPAVPTTHIVYDLVSRLASLEDAAWIWAIGAAADLGVDFVFEHGGEAVAGLRKRDILDAEVLINSAKRSSRYDIETPIRLLDRTTKLSGLVDRAVADVRTLEKDRAEVNREVRRCRHEKPHFSWKVAVIPFRSRCAIQGLIAETWKRQLENYLVLAANFGYIRDKVAYSVRTELDISVIDFMESLKPADYSRPVVWGHDRAAGGVLDEGVWLHIAGRMGFKDKG